MTVLNGNEVRTPTEPMVAAMNARDISTDADVVRAGQGGVLREIDSDDAPETTALEKQLPAEGPPALPWWLGDKYYWKSSGNGRHYLSPKESFLEYALEMTPKAANYGLGLVYPDGEHGVTTESDIVENMVSEAQSLLESFRAIGDNEAAAFEKFLIERCTRNAIYASTTQYELEQWAARDQNAADHQNFGEKQSRLDKFALAAGVAYAVVKEVAPQAEINFVKATRKAIYDQANFEGNKLTRPEQMDAQKAAAAEATKLTVRRFS